jgi:hypothetical protein
VSLHDALFECCNLFWAVQVPFCLLIKEEPSDLLHARKTLHTQEGVTQADAYTVYGVHHTYNVLSTA